MIRGTQHALRTVRDESAGNRRKIGRGAGNEGRRRRSKTRRQSVSRKKGQRIERRGETGTALNSKKIVLPGIDFSILINAGGRQGHRAEFLLKEIGRAQV